MQAMTNLTNKKLLNTLGLFWKLAALTTNLGGKYKLPSWKQNW
jgi:hypothetical protein